MATTRLAGRPRRNAWQDVRRDWQSWNRLERVSVMLITGLAVGALTFIRLQGGL